MRIDCPIVGKSENIRNLIKFVTTAASSDLPVLLLGETGVGKDLAAKLIHELSPRASRPFVNINFCSINDNLIESELFGHKRGTFTGATEDRIGLFEYADGGTILLNEIGDVPQNTQAKILSVLENREVRRVGTNVSVRINTRFIIATNKNLELLVEKGIFREDLYYRINILVFHIRPLRERREDIIPLIDHFLKNRCIGSRRTIDIEQNALDKLINYNYPGNARELDNILLRAVTSCSNDIIREKEIVFSPISNRNLYSQYVDGKRISVLEAIEYCEGNKLKAAKMLNISRTHLYRLLKDK